MPPSYPAGSYPAKVVADGAIAYWRLGETSGTTAVDVIGAKNGTISGGVTLGQSGALADGDKAMAFDGATGLFTAPASVLNCGPATQSFTVEFWIKHAGLGSGYRDIIRKGTYPFNNVQYGWGVTQLDATVFAFVRNPGGALSPPWLVFDRAPLPNVWAHIGVTYQSATGMATLYLDGTYNGQVTWSGADAGAYADTFNVELSGTNGYGPIAALIDEVAIYPTALTAPQIAAHYAARTWKAFGPAYQDMRYRWCRYVPRRVRR